jgi:sodium-coupled neutral amino acid transporter 11
MKNPYLPFFCLFLFVQSLAMSVNTDVDEDRNLVNDEEQGGASLMATTANYVNSIIGSGMIGIPFALKEAGFGLGLILLVLVGILTEYSLRLMVRAGTLSGTSSYQVNKFVS